MTLKVIGAGLGRTGTHSTQLALNQLGFPCYHMTEVILNKDNKSHLDFWRKAANSPPGTQQDWESIFTGYAATVDNPGCCVWRELMAAYPDAKVLLTLHPRGAEAWYESTMETIYFTENAWQFKVLELLTPFGRKFGDMSRKLIWGRTLNGVMGDKTKAVARYNAYVGEVKAAVPPDKLLIFKATDGWEPLCAFLDVASPDTKFPNVNDRAEFKKHIAGMKMGAYVILTGIAAAAVVVLGGAYWSLR
ncbi:MAG: sulfotransferase family protein [Roseiarcus sp.]